MKALFLSREDFEELFEQNIRIETYSKSIDSLFSSRMLEKIDYAPYYQRNYVWDANKATYFIESILLGTEIPPLIFFKSRGKIEIIDGRQRFETIKRFLNNEIKLTAKGLKALKQLARKTYSTLGFEELEARELFDDAKIRIIEFGISSDPPVSEEVEDKFKKEIFGRYNSGITPLKKSEIDNAKYDEDELSNYLKEQLKREANFSLFEVLTKRRLDRSYVVTVDRIMTIIRRNCALTIYPIKHYARGTNRSEMVERAYEFYSNQVIEKSSVEDEWNRIKQRVLFVNAVKEKMEAGELEYNWLMFDTLFWALGVLEVESNGDLRYTNNPLYVEACARELNKQKDYFIMQDYHFQVQTLSRYEGAAIVVNKILEIDIDLFISGGESSIETLKKLKEYEDPKVKLNELETLRITKPEPSRSSIDDISRMMGKKRFLIRPTYQRSEVISLTKASSIIESILELSKVKKAHS